MGAAAYNRGSKNIKRQIDMAQGVFQEPRRAKARPETWGDKARVRAEERAHSVLCSNHRYGRKVDLETLAEIVHEKARVSLKVALEVSRELLRQPVEDVCHR